MKKGIRNGLIVVALLAIAPVVISAHALVANGYEAHIGHPMFHFSALIAFCLGCVVGGAAVVLLAIMAVVGFVRNRK